MTQEDLAVTLLAFSYNVLVGVELVRGAPLPPDEQVVGGRSIPVRTTPTPLIPPVTPTLTARHERLGAERLCPLHPHPHPKSNPNTNPGHVPPRLTYSCRPSPAPEPAPAPEP